MTVQKPRAPHTFCHALTVIAAELTTDGAGDAIGKSGSLILKAADPDNDHQLKLPQALALDVAYAKATGQPVAPILAAYQHQFERERCGLAHKAADPLDAMCASIREHAEALTAYRAARSGRAGTVAINRARQEIAEARDALAAMERDLVAELEALSAPRVPRMAA